MPHSGVSYISEALSHWDESISPLANRYLGKNIYKELSDPGLTGTTMVGRIGVLAAATSQPRVVKSLCQHALYSVSQHDYLSLERATTTRALGWSASKVGLNGFANIMDIDLNFNHGHFLSHCVSSVITSQVRAGIN